MQKTRIDEFITLSDKFPVLDVRSPGEYNHAHIPGAYSLPLFTDEERKVTGTIYKQQGREAAIKTGLRYFGPKMVAMVEAAEEITKQHTSADAPQTVLVHCWRGGMRSAGVAWLLDLYGFKVYTLSGGYKSFRNWVLQQFQKKYPFKILGGYTGSGKTIMLKELKKNGEKVIDLEGIAQHNGSAFGRFGRTQPSQEMFENMLAAQLYANATLAPENGPIWLEDESRRIGSINLPHPLWEQMREAPVHYLDVPFEQRLAHIVAEYGVIGKEELVNGIQRIQKRLGSLNAKMAITFIEEGNTTECFRILLKYYDKSYDKAIHTKEEHIGFETIFKFKDGYVNRHTDVDIKQSDYKILETIAVEKAMLGNKVEILPEIITPNDPRRKFIMMGAKENKNPGLRINGQYVAVEEPKKNPLGKNTLVHTISEGAAQADHVIVNIVDGKVSEFELYKKAKSVLKQCKTLRTVEFRHRGKYLKFP